MKMRLRTPLFVLVAGWILIAPAFLVAQQSVDDSTITTNIQAKLFQDSTLKQRDVRVSTENGVVTLSGTVNTQLEKSAVERIASTERGVKEVIDRMTVASSSDSAASPDNASGSQSTTSTGTAPPAANTLSIPSGTVVTVRMIDSIDSKVNQPGQEFAASLFSPVVAGNQVVFPQGADARVRLVQAKQSGHIKGSSELQLELVSIMTNGKTYPVESGYYEVHGASRGKRTAEAVGGGAALGAIIGAIAGGGKGMAIGAGAGAATGAGVQAVTRGAQVKIPSETKLDFTLKAPISVPTSQ